MMTLVESTTDVAHAIQLAVAPVFLLTGIAGMLNVMTGRLNRIVDRRRALVAAPNNHAPDKLAAELKNLDRRRQFANAAITSCTLSALLACVVITTLFLEVMLGLPLQWLEGGFFAISTVVLIVGLSYFLREVHLATQTVRVETGL